MNDIETSVPYCPQQNGKSREKKKEKKKKNNYREFEKYATFSYVGS